MTKVTEKEIIKPKSSKNNPISRRTFLEKSFITVAGISTLGIYACRETYIKKEGIRVIAYNVLKCTGWPSEKVVEKSQMPARIAQELAKYNPDIINFSESPDESVIKEIASYLKMNYVIFPSAGNWPGTLFTHYKIINSENVPIVEGNRPKDLFTRHWGRATVQLPNKEIIIVHSAHLYPHDTPEARDIRLHEISEILKVIDKDIESGQSIIVMGDLNHTPETPEYSKWMDGGLIDSFVTAGKGNGLTIRADNPTKRIDYILASGPISKYITESRPLFEGGFRTNPTDSLSYALSDHLPQFAIFGTKN